jgi:hypothetical protein
MALPRYRANMAHARQSKPDSGLGLKVEVRQTFRVVGAGYGALDRGGEKPGVARGGRALQRLAALHLSRFTGPKRFWRLLLVTWLKPRPESGRDCLICTEFETA